MAYSAFPLAFGNIGADEIAGVPYLGVKLMDGTQGSTMVVPARSSAPAQDDAGLVVRAIPTTAQGQAVVQGTPGSSASPWWVRETNPSTGGAGGGSTAVDLASGGSTKVIGLVDGIPMTAARSSRNSSAEVELLAANQARRAAMIQNLTTAIELLVGLSTGAVSSAGTNVSFKVPANGFVVIGGQLGNIPLYTGSIRGKINSTAIAGPVAVTEFT